jgi:hypothetical protein
MLRLNISLTRSVTKYQNFLINLTVLNSVRIFEEKKKPGIDLLFLKNCCAKRISTLKFKESKAQTTVDFPNTASISLWRL